MKKFNALIIILALAVIFIPWLHPAGAADQSTVVNVYQNNQLVKAVVFKIGVPEYVVNGQTPGVKMDVAPFIESDRTFVPVRFLGNALGVNDSNINWNNDVQRVFIAFQNKISLVMQIGVKEIQVNATSKPIVAPLLKRDRTFLPARYVAEGLGYQVDWDEATQTVVCWPAGQPKPDVSAAVEYLNSQVPQQQEQTPDNAYVPAGWKLASAEGSQAYVPPDAERRYPNFYVLGKGVTIMIEGPGIIIAYPCKEFASAESDRMAKELLLANIGDPDMVQQILDYGAQKTTRFYMLPWKILPSVGNIEEIWVRNADSSIGVQIFPKK